MLPDVDEQSYAQYSADQFTSSATDRINALAAPPPPDPGLTAHLGGGPSPDVADAPPVAPSPPEAAPGPDVSLPPTTSAPASAPPQVQAPPLQPQQQPQSAQPDWIAGALNAVDQAGGDVQKFAQGLQTGAGDLVGSALNAADAAGADVQKFVSALPPVPAASDQSGASTGVGSVTPTTAGMTGGVDNPLGDPNSIKQRLLSVGANAAAPFGGDASKAVQATLVTEGGMLGAAGDRGHSFGPLQFYDQGQLAEFAKQRGLSLYDAGRYVQDHPDEAIQWAVGTPDKPGYLGSAIQRGLQKGIGGADLATYIQKTGQVSETPERAGANYNAMFANRAADASDRVAASQQNRAVAGDVFPVVGYQGDVNNHWGEVTGGSDLFAARGTPVVAMRGGKVVEAGYNAIGGNSVLIQGDDGNQYYYAHFDQAPSVKVGQNVAAGVYLGPVGNTGDAQNTGTHLHIGIGPSILLGADKYGGTGGDYDAVGLLRSTLAKQQQSQDATPSAAGPASINPSPTTNPIDWLGQQKDALTSSISSGASALGSTVQGWTDNLGTLKDATLGQTTPPVATQTTPSDSLTDPIGTRYTLPASGQPVGATSLPTTSAAPQDATSATPPPQGPLEAVKQKFSDAIDALGGLLTPHGANGEPLQPMTQQQMDTAYQNSGVRLPTSPFDALGGAGLGAPTSGEQLTTERNAAIEQANPLRDVPVVGGATTLAAQTALDPTNLLLGAGPELGRAAADVAGSIPARLPAESTAGFASGADALAAARSAVGGAPQRAAIEATQAPAEANTVSQLSAWLPQRAGPPGISVEPQGVPGLPGVPGTPRPEWGTSVVFRDETGAPQGILSITNDASGNPDVAEVAVNPAFQRQGIATQLYQAANDAGINVDAVTGRGGYTPQGAAFAQSRIDRGLVGSPVGGSPPAPTGPTGGGGQPPYQSVMPAGTFETPPPPSSGIGDRIANVQRNLTRAFTDRQVDVNQVQQAYQKALGRPLNADEMAAELQRLSPDAVAAVKIDEGLKPAIQSVGNDYQALRDYVTLRSNVEVADALGNDARNFSGGMTAGDSQQAIQTMQDQLGPQRFAKVQQAADQVTSFNQDLRQRLVDSGVLSPTQAAQMDTMYPNWAKTRILDYMADPAGGQGAGTKIGLADRNLRQYTLEGTTRAREDPIASTVAYAHQVERMANKNEAFNAMQQIDQASPNPQLRQVAQDFSPTKDQVTMVGFQNGQKLKYVTDNKALGEAINGAGTMSTPSWVSAWTKFVRATATSRNPLFLAGNAALDIPTYAFRSTIREGGPTIPALGRVFGQLAKGYADAFQGLLQGEYRGAGTSAFLKAGGGQSGYFTGGEGEAAQRIADLQRSNIFQVNNKADLLRLTKDVLTLKPVEGLGERIELGPRVAAYNLAKQRGANPVQAATEGRTVTVDFSQGGTVTKYLNNFIPFFNVGFQGPAQLVRAFRENPKAFVATTGTLLGVPSVAAEVWNHADPQRWQDYQDVPDYVKNQGIVIMSPGAASVDAQGNRKPGYAVIKLREWAPFAQIARSAADVAFGDNQRTWQQMAASIGTGLSPTNATSVSQVGSEPLAGIPALPAALQLQQNRDFFRNRNIVTTRNDQNASALAKGLAPLMQRAVDAAGLNAEIRPSAIDFFIRDQGAGAGGAALGASDIAAGTPRQDTTAQSLPGVGGLIGRFSGSQTGQNLQSSRDVGLTPSAREILRSNGITTTPGAVSSKVNGIPLKLDEEARYQDLFNRYSDDAIQRAARSSDWPRLSQQGKQSRVQQLIDAARSRAGNEVLNSLPAAEKQQRLRVGATAP